MYDVITIGSAFQDVYLFSKKFRVLKDTRVITGEMECFAFGTKIELDDILFEVGGGATNSANTFKRQGLKVACLTKVGNDGAGQEVCKFLRQSKIGDLVVADPAQRTAHSVFFLGPRGERTILVYRGASHDFKDRDINFAKIKQTRWLYISSLAGNVALLEKIVRFANKYNVKVALNPGKLEIKKGSILKNRILKYADILFVNREEASLMTGRTYSDERGLVADLKKKCPGIVVVTMGEEGSVVAPGNDSYRVKIKPVKAVDTTGAGDSFGSGFLAGIIRFRGDIKQAIALAVNNSAADVQAIGAKHGALSKNDKLDKVRFSVKKLN